MTTHAKHVRTGPAPLAPNMQTLAMPHAGGGGHRMLPLDDGRPVEPSGGNAGREQPYSHVVHEYDETKIRPLGARVIVRLLPDPDTSPSGLVVVPDAAKQRPTRGRVVAVGPGREYPNGRVVPVDLVPGDVVYFKKWADVSVFDQRNQDRSLVAVSQEEVLCVVEPVSDARDQFAKVVAETCGLCGGSRDPDDSFEEEITDNTLGTEPQTRQALVCSKCAHERIAPTRTALGDPWTTVVIDGKSFCGTVSSMRVKGGEKTLSANLNVGAQQFDDLQGLLNFTEGATHSLIHPLAKLRGVDAVTISESRTEPADGFARVWLELRAVAP